MEKIKIEYNMPTKIELLNYSKSWYAKLYGVKFSDWNDVLLSNSYPLDYFKLSENDLDGLVSEKPNHINVLNLQDRLDLFLTTLPYDNYFTKLISRSPKDVLCEADGSIRNVKNADDIIGSIMNSMRCFEDICSLIKLNVKDNFIIRPYIEIAPKNEWRCFIKQNKLIAVTQYHYFTDYEYSEKYIDDTYIRIKTFIDEICIPNIITSHFVADLIVTENDIKLLETNPYGLSDPCLYVSYENIEKEENKILIKK